MLIYEVTRFLENSKEKEDDDSVYFKAIFFSLEDVFKKIIKIYDYRSTISIIVWDKNQFLGETRIGGNE
jgi:hypothetical protein